MRIRLFLVLLLGFLGCSSEPSLPSFEVYGDGLAGPTDLSVDVPGPGEDSRAETAPGLPPTPCTSDEDCESGLCLTTLMQPACALPCDDGLCQIEGFGCFAIKGTTPDGSKQLCLPKLSLLCIPCQEDSDCRTVTGGGGGRCLMLGGAGTFCTVPCVQHEDCPLGYKCMPFADEEGKLSGQCQPKIDQCVCGEMGKKVGWESACSFVNEWGSCSGEAVCPKSGSAKCSATIPAEDLCNGLDDDCDGDIDDGGQIGKPCGKSSKGLCKMGIVVCSKDLQEVCDGNVDPAPEICDDQDNNCEGQTDEEFPEDNAPCGLAVGICKQGKTWCNKGKLDCKGDVKPQTETCNSLDDDCDGATDEELPGTGDKCGSDKGVCKSGQKMCQDGNWVCDGEVKGSNEVCDGKDNDCNGTEDDMGYTSCGLGVCAHSVPNCINGQWQTCNPYQGASAEVCDGQDNDCDGVVDPGCGGGDGGGDQ